MTSQDTFEYRVFQLENVLFYTNKTFSDSKYMGNGLPGNSRQDWDEALASGYRWIRTDGELVIMERKSKVIMEGNF